MRENVFFRYVLLLLIALPLGFLVLYPQLWRCIRISQSADYRLLTGLSNVYVNQSATASQQHTFQQHVITARSRIQRFWGDRRGQATLIYCPRQSDYEQYCAGGEGAGCSIGTPWGAAYLILGPDGNNTDVIAHELCHDELFARLGWWRVKQQIPQWFNEGLALMVDYRFSNPSLWEKPDSSVRPDSAETNPNPMPFPPRPMLKLTDLETTRNFFGGDYAHTMLAYQTAAEEVTRWLSIVGRASIPILSNSVAKGDSFVDTYRRLEREKRAMDK
ncbi:hypothetical protein [Spirosoma validum]|uniref:Uncharacterized protein n=1 Tax=Spirosoma validum TaxID=2771355 RepID=A0A927B196_9BACT|nr:hypothetical protein [Spirosoma validum]MBD2753568.1 hypothetical protein [Spirosoma validum]